MDILDDIEKIEPDVRPDDDECRPEFRGIAPDGKMHTVTAEFGHLATEKHIRSFIETASYITEAYASESLVVLCRASGPEADTFAGAFGHRPQNDTVVIRFGAPVRAACLICFLLMAHRRISVWRVWTSMHGRTGLLRPSSFPVNGKHSMLVRGDVLAEDDLDWVTKDVAAAVSGIPDFRERCSMKLAFRFNRRNIRMKTVRIRPKLRFDVPDIRSAVPQSFPEPGGFMTELVQFQ